MHALASAGSRCVLRTCVLDAGVALSAAGAAEMPGLLRLSTQEKALKERRRLQE